MVDMDVDTKISLIKDFTEEIVTEGELRGLFEVNDHPIAYDGFEPSGIAPIHFGLLRATNLKNMLKVGIKFKLYLADYFAFINNKLEGNLESIRKAGEYFIEVWKACGIDTSKVEVIWAKNIMNGIEYWDKMLRVAKETTLSRSMKSVTIMGRKEGENLSTAQMMYPSMQVTDIFQLGVNICQLGLDQRRANMLARDVAEKLNWDKPIAAHHHIILGLQGMPGGVKNEDSIIEAKMSKSNPKTAIYMHNTFEELREKLNSAYCPAKIIEGNPVLEYAKYIIFKEIDRMIIERPSKYGGNLEVQSYDELERNYREGKLHPSDLKLAVAVELNKLIKPVREYFETNTRAKELYEGVKQLKITR